MANELFDLPDWAKDSNIALPEPEPKPPANSLEAMQQSFVEGQTQLTTPGKPLSEAKPLFDLPEWAQEGTFKSLGKSFMQGVQEVKGVLGAKQLEKAIEGLALEPDPDTLDFRERMQQALGETESQRKARLFQQVQEAVGTMTEAGQRAQELEPQNRITGQSVLDVFLSPEFTKGEAAQAALQAMARNAPNLLLSMGAYAAGRGAGGTTGGAITASATSFTLESGDIFQEGSEYLMSKYGNLDSVPKDDWKKLLEITKQHGVLNAALDSLSVASMFKTPGIKEAARKALITKILSREGLKEISSDALKGLVAEVGTELTQEGSTILGATRLGKDFTGREVAERLTEAGVAAGGLGAVGGAGGGAVNILQAGRNAEALQAAQKAREQLFADLPDWAKIPDEPKGEAFEDDIPVGQETKDIPFEQAPLTEQVYKPYTTRVLERLPQKPTLKRISIEQELNRQDVKKDEKELIRQVVENKFAGQEEISREDFIREVASQLPPLTMGSSHQYADFGLTSINGFYTAFEELSGPDIGGMDTATDIILDVATRKPYRDSGSALMARRLVDMAGTEENLAALLDGSKSPSVDFTRAYARFTSALKHEAGKAQTHIWNLPYATSTQHHFGRAMPNYAAHTRVHTIGETRNILEVQSDIAQRRSTPISEVARIRLLDELAVLNREAEELRRDLDRLITNTNRDITTAPVSDRRLRDQIQHVELRRIEINNALAGESVVPGIGEHLYTLAIREENRQAARDGIKTLRIATPETLKKIEGWEGRALSDDQQQALDKRTSGILRRQEQLNKFVKKVYGAKPYTDRWGVEWLEWAVDPQAATSTVEYYQQGLNRGESLRQFETKEQFDNFIRTQTARVIKAQMEFLRGEATRAAAAKLYGADISYNALPTGVTMLGFRFENSEKFGNRISKQIADWMSRFAPDVKLVVQDGMLDDYMRVNYPSLVSSRFALGQIIKTDDNVWLMTVNTNVHLYPTKNQTKLEGYWQSTAAHEFGHMLAVEAFLKLPPEMSREIVRDFRKDTDFMLANSLGVALARRESIMHYLRETDGFDSDDLRLNLYEITQKYPAFNVEYFFSFDEWLANQYARWATTTELASNSVERFFKRIAELLRRLFEYISEKHFKPAPNYEKFLSNLEREIIGRPPANKQLANDIVEVARSKVPSEQAGLSKEAQRLADEVDKYNAFRRQFTGLTNLVKSNPHILALGRYMQLVRDWSASKQKWYARADERVREWYGLGKDQSNRLAKMLLDETISEKFFDLSNRKIIDKYGLEADALEMAIKIKEDFALMLDVIEAALIADAQKSLVNQPTALNEKVDSIRSDFDNMRSRPYFPLPRFGQHTIVVRALADNITYQGKKFQTGQIMEVSMHETERARDQRLRETKADLAKQIADGTVRVAPDKIPEQVFSFQGFPPAMLAKLEEALQLSDEQINALRQYTHELAPGQSWRKHLIRRRNVLGFSEDAMRGYAAYMFHAASHIARITYYREMSQAIQDVNESANRQQRLGSTNTPKRRKIVEHMQRHFKYIMNPETEWEGARAFGFLWYLSLVPKAAMINLSQVPMVTYPYLAARHGDVKTVAHMTKAIDTLRQTVTSPKKVDPNILRMLEEGKAAGFLNESFAAELAAVSNGSILERMIPTTEPGRRMRQFAYVGAFLFHKAEVFNRYWTAVSTYTLAREQGIDHNQAFNAVRDAVESTQFEYAKWDRPELLRGKKSILFLFKRYIIGMMWYLGQDPGRVRTLGMIMLLAGVSGLPFADDMMDLVTWLETWRRGQWFDSRRELREFVIELGANPDWVIHGAGHRVFGHFDMSASLSLGDVIPGTKLLATPGEFEDRLPETIEEAGGPFVRIPLQMLNVAMSNEPISDVRTLEKAVPTWIRSVMQSYRFAQEGTASSPSGRKLVEFDPDELLWVVPGKALGAQPTQLSKAYERERMFRDAHNYYQLRREAIMKAFFLAKLRKDREAEADVRKEMAKYNAGVRSFEPALKISGADLARSYIDRLKNMKFMEKGVAPELRYRRLYKDINNLFKEDMDTVESKVHDDSR